MSVLREILESIATYFESDDENMGDYKGLQYYFDPYTINANRDLPLICFDVRFPDWSRNKVKNNHFDYDCLVYTTNFPAPREKELMTLVRARAIENQSYALVVNRVGTDGYQRKYAGGCAIINPHGEIESQTTTQKEEILIHSCDFDSIKSIREQFPISKFW